MFWPSWHFSPFYRKGNCSPESLSSQVYTVKKGLMPELNPGCLNHTHIFLPLDFNVGIVVYCWPWTFYFPKRPGPRQIYCILKILLTKPGEGFGMPGVCQGSFQAWCLYVFFHNPGAVLCRTKESRELCSCQGLWEEEFLTFSVLIIGSLFILPVGQEKALTWTNIDDNFIRKQEI